MKSLGCCKFLQKVWGYVWEFVKNTFKKVDKTQQIGLSLLSISIFFIILKQKNFLVIYNYNKSVSWLLIACILFLVSVVLILKLKKGEAFSFVAISVTIFFFLFKSTLESIKEENTKQHVKISNFNIFFTTTMLNCSVATSTIQDFGYGNNVTADFSLALFSTGVLKEMLPFIFQNFPLEEAQRISKSILNMDSANAIIQINQNLNVIGVLDKQEKSYEVVKRLNKNLYERVEEIYNDFCPKDGSYKIFR